MLLRKFLGGNAQRQMRGCRETLVEHWLPYDLWSNQSEKRCKTKTAIAVIAKVGLLIIDRHFFEICSLHKKSI